MKIIRVAVTGGRDYTNKDHVWKTLDTIKAKIELTGSSMLLVVGDAKGADKLSFDWASARGVTKEYFVAEWDYWEKQGRRNYAGLARNIRMLESGVDFLCAFPGGRGTAHMTNICKDAFVKVKDCKET
jgi:hypothetical protein